MVAFPRSNRNAAVSKRIRERKDAIDVSAVRVDQLLERTWVSSGDQALQSRNARVGDFRRLVDRYDPAGKFRNAFLSRNIYEE